MSLPPPGLGGGGARTGPPPGFGTSNASGGNPPNSAGGIGGGTRNNNGTAPIVKAQIVFQLTNLSEENFEKVSKELREVSLGRQIRLFLSSRELTLKKLASANGHEMYYHLLNRICMAANPYIQGLSQHFQQYKEDPAAPPHNLPTHSLPAVAWRLLVSEAARAARDVSLAPQFTHAVLSPLNSTCLPIPSLRLLGLPPQILFALAAHSLAATHIFPSSHPSYQNVQNLTYQTYDATFDELVRPGSNFWTYQISPNHAPFSEDLSMQEARTLLLAIYPRSTPSGGSVSRPPTPTNPTSPHPALLDTYLRAQFIRGLIHKFASPAIIQQTLTALSPGGSTRSQSSIPLEHILFELGELTQDEHTVDAIIQRWWNPWVLEGDDSQQLHAEMAMTLHGLLEGLMAKRVVHVPVVVKVLTLIVSQHHCNTLTTAWYFVAQYREVIRCPRSTQERTYHHSVKPGHAVGSTSTRPSHRRSTPRLDRRATVEQHKLVACGSRGNHNFCSRRFPHFHHKWRLASFNFRTSRRPSLAAIDLTARGTERGQRITRRRYIQRDGFLCHTGGHL
jgi:CCR4-NOT transcription complex subunit 1